MRRMNFSRMTIAQIQWPIVDTDPEYSQLQRIFHHCDQVRKVVRSLLVLLWLPPLFRKGFLNDWQKLNSSSGFRSLKSNQDYSTLDFKSYYKGFLMFEAFCWD